MTAKQLLVAAVIGLLSLPGAAFAQGAVAAQEAAGIVSGEKSRWRGSSLSYSNVFTTISLKKDVEPTWNPYYAQNVQIAPRYYFFDDVYASVIWSLEQELTDSDWTTTKREVMWSDVFVDLGYSGWTEPTTKLRFNGSVRLALPASKISQAQTQLFAASPSVRVSRSFDVLQGLTLGLGGRWTQRFHNSTTAEYDAVGIVKCSKESPTCERSQSTGVLNAWGDYSVGPSVSLMATDKLYLSADLRFGQAFLYEDSTEAVVGGIGNGGRNIDTDFSGRYNQYFAMAASYFLMDELTITAGLATPSAQLDPEGLHRSPFFNRFTQVFFDLDFNLDAIASRF